MSLIGVIDTCDGRVKPCNGQIYDAASVAGH